MRRKDVVLMATVTSFETLPRPSRPELRQFAELFAPLFSASSETARREAAAALSQSPHVPPAVAFFIASQPIAVAAPFLTASPALTDEALIAIARSQGEAHARAIVGRAALSATVIDALVALRCGRRIMEAGEAEAPAGADEAHGAHGAEDQTARDEKLRARIKALAAHISRPEADRLGLRNISPIQEALLLRFARSRETGLIASVLADTLSASRWLAERILLDISGQQLAVTLKGLAMGRDEALAILTRLYDHLAITESGESRAERLWNELDGQECGQRLESWRRADRYTEGRAGEPADSGQREPAVIRTTASRR